MKINGIDVYDLHPHKLIEMGFKSKDYFEGVYFSTMGSNDEGSKCRLHCQFEDNNFIIHYGLYFHGKSPKVFRVVIKNTNQFIEFS